MLSSVWPAPPSTLRTPSETCLLAPNNARSGCHGQKKNEERIRIRKKKDNFVNHRYFSADDDLATLRTTYV
jgi:hypothetical protein